ncbi:hypothetical protein OC842_002461 [Tilletia horrida]|uniref:Uncharacterized protein n=1 Tax=Tilletia horrida TaxID=155126 RepID=A0AAN6GD74_9BASI|nr:hypothetical protein OC842_002461 [Tilletia horrida]
MVAAVIVDSATNHGTMTRPTIHGDGKTLTWDNGIAAADTLVTLFTELAYLAPFAGPFLAMGLGVVKEIFAIVQDVSDSRDACELFATRVMHILSQFARAAQSAQRPILPGTAAAVLLEPFVGRLKSFHDDLQAYAALSTWRRSLKRKEIRDALATHNRDLDLAIASLTAQGTFIQLIRSDYQLAQPVSIHDELRKISAALEQQNSPARPPVSTTPLQPTASVYPPQNYGTDNAQWEQMQDLQFQLSRIVLRDSQADDLAALLDQSDLSSIQDDRVEPDQAHSALAYLNALCDEKTEVGTAQTSGASLAHMLHLSDSLHDLGRLEDSLLVLQSLTAQCRRNTAMQPAHSAAIDRTNLGAALIKLSNALRLLDRHEEALASADEATTIFKQAMLSREGSSKYNAALARSLRALASAQNALGRITEALNNTRHSLSIYRRLRTEQHTQGQGQGQVSVEVRLASTLNNYSILLSDAGRYREALDAIEECLQLRRALHTAHPASLSLADDLANTLNNYSFRLSVQGGGGNSDGHTALKAIEESVTIRRTLYAARPAAYEAALAKTLSNYAVDLAHAGRRDEALDTVEESIHLYRSLAVTRPGCKFESELARTLANYSVDLAHAGRDGDALRASEESVGLYRALHSDRAREYESDLAGSLEIYSNRLRHAGRAREALEAMEESVRLYRSSSTSAHRRASSLSSSSSASSDLARVLASYSRRLQDVGKTSEALTQIEQSVALYASLHAARPAAFSAEYAKALRAYAYQLSDADRHTQALTTLQDSAALFRELYEGAEGDAEGRPAISHLAAAEYATTLRTLSLQLDEAGRSDEALTVISKCVRIYQSLHAAAGSTRGTPSNTYAQDLARALRTQSYQLSQAGAHKDSLAAIEQSVALYRSMLASISPSVVTEAAKEYKTELARALSDYAVDLANAGRAYEGLGALRECLALRRALLTASSTATPTSGSNAAAETAQADLARTLRTYALRLSERAELLDYDDEDEGRLREEAVAALEESVALYAALSARHPTRYASDLASAKERLLMLRGKASAGASGAGTGAATGPRRLRSLMMRRPKKEG